MDGTTRKTDEQNVNLDAFHPYWVPSDDPKAPVLILLHGTGGNERQMVGLARQILGDRPASLLGLRGQELEQGYVTRWFKRLREGVFDTQSVGFRSFELAHAVKQAGERFGFDSSEAIAVGYSNGANIAAALLLLHPDVLGAGVLIRSMLPLRPEDAHDLTGKRVLMLTGRNDPYGPRESSDALAELLRKGGADVEHPILAVGHEIIEEDLMIARSWLDRKIWDGGR